MAERRRAGRRVIGAVVLVGTVAGAAWTLSMGRRGGERPAAPGAQSPGELAARIRQGDAAALAALAARLQPAADAKTTAEAKGGATPLHRPIPEAEIDGWMDALTALRVGYPRLEPSGRARALAVVGAVLDRLAVDPAPKGWFAALSPAHDLFLAGLADAAPLVRVAALSEIARLWVWIPGRTPQEVEEELLGNWKEGLHVAVVRDLGSPEPTVRAAAVACLGRLPIDASAAPAVAYLSDPEPDVRRQVLASFAGRPALLPDEAILPLFLDTDPRIVLEADVVLRARGLSRELIGLGRMVFHPEAKIRASAIELILQRDDIDPAVWLLRLSHDPAESVRVRAVAALRDLDSPEVRRRLGEMALIDPSPAVREAAGKVAPPADSTAALPPLPGSPSLNPRAN